MSVNEKKLSLIVAAGLVSLSFLFFRFFYPYHLFFKEQIQLFLWSKDYFLTYFNKPAWLACYAGDFLTQFFYLRGGGPVVLSVLFFLEWLLSSLVIKKLFKSDNSLFWGLFPAGVDWILYCGLLHPVSFSVGFILILFLFLIYTSVSSHRAALVTGFIITLLAYWLAGSSSLLLPLLIFFREWDKDKSAWFWGLLAGVPVILMPVLFRVSYLLTFPQAFIYPAFENHDMLLPGALVFSISGTWLTIKTEASSRRIINSVIILLFAVILSGGIRMHADFNTEKILSLDSENYFGNPDRVIELSQKYGLKDRLATYFTNVALATKDELPDKLMQFYQPAFYGLILPVSPQENWITILFSNEAFFLWGDMNLAQHSAMLGMTFSPFQRSSRLVKRLAEINIINADTAAATKYLRLLDKTMFHRKWARSREKINHTTASSEWLKEKRAQIAVTDTLRKSYDYLASLRFLVEQKPGNIVALDYLMCYYLLNKDLKSFREVYDRYGRQMKRSVPAVYGEAMMILLYTSHAAPEEIAGYSLSLQKMKDFRDYTDLFQQTGGNMETLKERFGKTYWFYFHFAAIQLK